jgi:hypothetical protein
MKSIFQSFAFLILSIVLAACSNESPSSPSPVTTVKFSATLLSSNEVPPVSNSEAGGSATADITFRLTQDTGGAVSAASMDVTVTATGFPSGTALTRAHIHPGGAGINGGVFVNVGIADGEIRFASGSGAFTRTGIALTVEQANAIVANPAGFYLNIHTASNPDGAARGQLTRVQ